MITKPKKHRTRVPGVTVTVNPSGGFTVNATAAAVKRWPWDGSTFPCASLRKGHRFTFESNGDLCDLETKQKDSRDGVNGEAVSALAGDCKALAVDLIEGLNDSKPPCVSSIIYNANTLDCFSFVYRLRKGEANQGNRLALFTCETGRAFSQHGEAAPVWIEVNRRNLVRWEAVPGELRRHVKSVLAFIPPPPPPPARKVSKAKQACLAYLGNRGIYEEVKRAAYFQGLWFIVFENCPGEVEVSFSCLSYECYDIHPAKGFAWSKSNFAKIKANLEGNK